MRHRTLLISLAVLAVALLAACGDGDDGPAATATLTQPTPPPPTPTVFRPTTEQGEDPIYWRTADEFGTLRSGEPYKILFRITGGFAEDRIAVGAYQVGIPVIEYDAFRAEPQGEDLPGSYYPMNLTLPAAGEWLLDVVAGDYEVRFTVQALEPEG